MNLNYSTLPKIKKGNKILVSLKKTHMIWHIRRFGKWKKGLFGFSTFRNSIWSISTFQLFEIQYEACPLFNVSTFRLFEIENETLPLFDFSTFRNWQWSLSTFQFFDFDFFNVPSDWNHAAYFSNPEETPICAMIKRRYERLQLRSAITTQNMWFTVCSDRGPCVAIPLFRLCLWLSLPVGRMTFQSFDVRVRHWSSRSGLVFLGSWKMACRQVYMR